MLGFVRKVSVVAMYVGCCVPIVSLPSKHVAGMVYRQLHSDRHSTRPAFLIHSQKISKVKVYIFIEKKLSENSHFTLCCKCLRSFAFL